MLFERSKPSQQMLDKLEDKLNILGAMLEGKRFAIGDQLTIADISLACNVGYFISEGHGPKVVEEWYDRVLKKIPTLEKANKAEAVMIKQIVTQ